MSVYRPARSPFYHYDFQFRGQRFTGSTGLTSKTEARAKEASIRREIATGEKRKPQITLDEAGGLWWQEKGKYESASATAKGQLKRMTAALGAGTALTDIDTGDLERFIATRRGQTTNRKTLVSNATVNREMELLKRIMRHVAARYAVPEIEWGRLRLREAAERVREMSADEEKRFWASAPNDDLAAVAEFALLSGQRRTSVITLLWSKVYLNEMAAEVRVKGGRWHRFPLTTRMADLIRMQPRICAQVFTYVCERPSPPRTDRPRRLRGHRYPFSKQGWMRKWRKWLADAKIEDFRFHDLRHTCGTRLLRATGNLKLVKELFDHSDIATSARYAHALEHDVRAGMNQAQSRIIPEQASGDEAENDASSRGCA